MSWLLLGLALGADPQGGFPADAWRPPLEADGLLAVEGAELPRGWEARLDGSWALRPLVAVGEAETVPLVQHLLSVQASASGRLGPLRLGARAPLGAVIGGESVEKPSFAAGDPSLSLKLCSGAGRPLAAAVQAELSLPLGGERLWLGATGASFSALLILDARIGAWRLALDGGLRAQPEADLVWDSEERGPSLGRQALAAGAIAREIGENGRLSLEVSAALGLDPRLAPQSTPLELLAGWRGLRPDGGLWRVGLGVGVLPGVGAPAARLLVGGGARPR